MTGTAFFILIVVVVVVVSLLGMVVVRRLVPRERLTRHTDIAGYVYAVVGVIYGVILAQVVVAGWDDYREAGNVAVDEASAVLSLDRLSREWPAAQRSPVQEALVAYTHHVINEEWPAMSAGEASIATEHGFISDIWETYNAVAQSPIGATANYAASLDQLDNLDEARRTRAILGTGGLPQTMTLTLLLGGIVTVGFSYLFPVDDRWVHGLITTSLALMVALMLLLAFQLESPFQGPDAIGPSAMEDVLDEISSANP